MRINILRNISLLFACLILSACYTIVDQPLDHEKIDLSYDNIIDDNSSSEEYIIINNYNCNNHDGNCHSHSSYNTCCNHHLSYNWWTGHYTCSSYYWNGYNNYAHGYYHNYWWGYNSGWWNSGNDSGDDYANNDQERRDRSFERFNNNDGGVGDNNTLIAIEHTNTSKQVVTPINHKGRYRESIPPIIASKQKSYKSKSNKKKNKGNGLLSLIFGSKKIERKSTSSNSSSYHKDNQSNQSENSKKSNSKKKSSKNNRKKTRGNR